MKKTLIKNIGRLQTPEGSYPHKGEDQGRNRIAKNMDILVEGGIISAISPRGTISPEGVDILVDAEGCLVTPGLVDGHTHLVFGGYRQNEIPLKLAGADYLEILKAGGGILDTLNKTRRATFRELEEKSQGFLDEMMSLGVTTCEAKSGYGLDMETEMKMLKVIDQLSQSHPMDIVSTFMGAHMIPPEYKDRGDDYIDLLCREILPAVAESGLARFVDVFCEEGVFDPEQSRKYLQAAKDLGLGLKIHADEIEEIGGSHLAGEMGCISAEHLIAIGREGMASLKAGGTTAMCLPATSFYLNKSFAPAKKMIEMGIPVAMATDFNPGSCPSLNLQLVINLGYLKYRMTPEEILTAVTVNPACAIGQGDLVGTLEVGKQGDLVIWDAPDMEMLCYRLGSNLASTVIKKGEIVS